ncbi:MAG TPA: hypothetical protein V6C85_00745 [Allocoleopsis sp.]
MASPRRQKLQPEMSQLCSYRRWGDRETGRWGDGETGRGSVRHLTIALAQKLKVKSLVLSQAIASRPSG